MQLPNDLQERQEFNLHTYELLKTFIEHFGRHPSDFYAVPKPMGTFELPLIKRDDGIFGILSKRKTIRVFDMNIPLTLEELSLIVYYVFGAHGFLPMYEDIVSVHKISPSGGSLHPTEVYLLVMNVADLILVYIITMSRTTHWS